MPGPYEKDLRVAFFAACEDGMSTPKAMKVFHP